MKELINTIKNMAMASLHGLQGIFIKGTIVWMKEMDMEKCFLRMGLYIREIGREVSRLEKLL